MWKAIIPGVVFSSSLNVAKEVFCWEHRLDHHLVLYHKSVWAGNEHQQCFLIDSCVPALCCLLHLCLPSVRSFKSARCCSLLRCAPSLIVTVECSSIKGTLFFMELSPKSGLLESGTSLEDPYGPACQGWVGEQIVQPISDCGVRK